MKLKVIFAATLLAAMTLSSCSSDTPVDAAGNVARGEATYASFNLSLKNTGSRAANGDEYADESEQNIEKLHIYVFADGILELDHEAEGFTLGTAVGPVKITTGEKVVYAVAGDLTVEGNVFEGVVESTRLSDFEKIVYASLPENIAVADKFVMAGRKDGVIITQSTQAAPCKVSLNITRAATKTQLKYGNDEGVVNVRSTINATFADAEFSMMQMAQSMWLTPGNYTVASKPSNGGTYTGYTAVPATVADDQFVEAVTEFDGAPATSRYTGEAYNEKPVTGNTTFALVRLKATPSKIFKSYDKTKKEYTYGGQLGSNGTFCALAKNDAKTASFIFASDNEYNILYFSSNSAATAARTTLGLSNEWKVQEYTNGNVYYRVNLITDAAASATGPDKYCALRNHFYKITVTDIKALGAPNAPGVVPTDPDQPLESEAWIETTIELDNWVPVDMDNTTLQ